LLLVLQRPSFWDAVHDEPFDIALLDRVEPLVEHLRLRFCHRPNGTSRIVAPLYEFTAERTAADPRGSCSATRRRTELASSVKSVRRAVDHRPRARSLAVCAG